MGVGVGVGDGVIDALWAALETGIRSEQVVSPRVWNC